MNTTSHVLDSIHRGTCVVCREKRARKRLIATAPSYMNAAFVYIQSFCTTSFSPRKHFPVNAVGNVRNLPHTSCPSSSFSTSFTAAMCRRGCWAIFQDAPSAFMARKTFSRSFPTPFISPTPSSDPAIAGERLEDDH